MSEISRSEGKSRFLNWRFWRRAHLYLGCFFAPMMLFFVMTGWYQTFNPNRTKTPSEAQSFLQKMVSIHVEQIYPNPTAESFSPQKFKLLVGLMSAALLITTVIGLALAFQLSRNPWPVTLSLVFGVAVPMFLLWLGQKGS